MSMRGCHLAPSAVNTHCGMVYRGRLPRKHRGRRVRFPAPGSSERNSRAKALWETHTWIGGEPQFSLLRGQPPEWEPARASHQKASGCFWGESCPFSKSQPTWVTMDRVYLGERSQQPRSSVLCLAGPTCGYVWRNVRTLCEMDLAVFGKRLLFRVCPSLQLPVISKILKFIDGETPNQIGFYSELLWWEGNSDVDTDCTFCRRTPTKQFVKLFSF